MAVRQARQARTVQVTDPRELRIRKREKQAPSFRRSTKEFNQFNCIALSVAESVREALGTPSRRDQYLLDNIVRKLPLPNGLTDADRRLNAINNTRTDERNNEATNRRLARHRGSDGLTRPYWQR